MPRKAKRRRLRRTKRDWLTEVSTYLREYRPWGAFYDWRKGREATEENAREYLVKVIRTHRDN